MAEIDKFATDNVCKVLVGNKCDLTSKRVVSTEDGENLAKTYGVPYLETSAKVSQGVEDTFMTMAKQIKSNLINRGQFGNVSAPGSQPGFHRGHRLA